MKTTVTILIIIGATVGAFVAGSIYSYIKVPVTQPQQLTLEKILSIKELHLVRHTYQDLFFLHRQNDPSKNIRAIIQVPVEITAFLNLKEIEFIKQGDSIKQIILPRAQLNAPHYNVSQMVVRETKSWQVHVGRDLYKEVNHYLQSNLLARQDSISTLANSNRILTQAEEEGKQYLIQLLYDLGRVDIEVKFREAVNP